MKKTASGTCIPRYPTKWTAPTKTVRHEKSPKHNFSPKNSIPLTVSLNIFPIQGMQTNALPEPIVDVDWKEVDQ